LSDILNKEQIDPVTELPLFKAGISRGSVQLLGGSIERFLKSFTKCDIRAIKESKSPVRL